MPTDTTNAKTTTSLHQINAVLTAHRPQAERRWMDLNTKVRKAPLLSGIHRTFQPIADDDPGLPDEKTRVQLSATDVVGEVGELLGRWFDLQFAQDATNCTARADVTVDGKTVLADAPVTYLLFLEKQLVHLRSFIDGLPLLDPADEWNPDPDRGGYASEPVQTVSTKKALRVLELAAATDKHPAQVKPYETDEPRGRWTTVKLSGALPGATVREYRRRVDALIEAVKVAREAANGTPITDRKVGKDMLGYVFAPVAA